MSEALFALGAGSAAGGIEPRETAMSDLDRLTHLARTGRLSRRQFVERAAALGAGTALATSLAGKVFAAAPTKGGHLKIGFDGAGATDSLDPATYTAEYIKVVGYLWGNTLVELDESNKTIPELAESWAPNADATQWVFKLRKGVSFHNGKEMTAGDVVYSINHHRGADSKSGAQGYLQAISDVKATDPLEVTVTLTSGNVDIPYIFTDYHLLIVPDGSDWNKPIGTGGYTIDSFEPGVRTSATRIPDYWKEGRAHADSVEVLAINDVTARTSALQTGAVHFINRLDPKTVGLLKRAPGVQVIDMPSAGHYCFPMRCDTAPFDNADVRLALKYGLNRPDLVEKILRGYGKIGNDQPIPQFDPMFAADIPQRPYDPDKAKFHMQKSGYDGPITLYASDTAFAGAVDAATLYQAHLSKAGIKLEIVRAPADGYWSDVWMAKPFCASYWGGRPTADLMFAVAYVSDAAWNESFWKRPAFDQLLKQARAELDTAKRKQMFHDLQMMVYDDGGEVIPMFNDYLFGSRANVDGIVSTPLWSGLRCGEQLYFTA
jgi:peptide/nickel transport system substrate-binding protein